MKVTPVQRKFGKYSPGEVFDFPDKAAKVFIRIGKLAPALDAVIDSATPDPVQTPDPAPEPIPEVEQEPVKSPTAYETRMLAADTPAEAPAKRTYTRRTNQKQD